MTIQTAVGNLTSSVGDGCPSSIGGGNVAFRDSVTTHLGNAYLVAEQSRQAQINMQRTFSKPGQVIG